MLRTLDEYVVPTLDCVIWERYRGEGRGKQLVRKLLKEAAELGFERVRLTVFPDNVRAIKAFERAGVREDRPRRDRRRPILVGRRLE